MKQLTNNLKKLRLESEMTQKELARACGYKSNPIALWESGQREPSISNAYKVADALRVTVQDIWRPS